MLRLILLILLMLLMLFDVVDIVDIVDFVEVDDVLDEYILHILLCYRGIHDKASGDVVSAVCYTIYTIHLSLYTHKQLRRHLPNPFRKFPCIMYDEITKNYILSLAISNRIHPNIWPIKLEQSS